MEEWEVAPSTVRGSSRQNAARCGFESRTVRMGRWAKRVKSQRNGGFEVLPTMDQTDLGPVAQLGERSVRNAEVTGSIPVRSTTFMNGVQEQFRSMKEIVMTKEELLAELAKRGIEVEIGGCGCCSSPWVTVTIDGETVFQEDDVHLSSSEAAKQRE